MRPSLTVHDSADFPLVRLRPDATIPGYVPVWCAEMNQLLANGERFILIYPPATQQEGHEDRKQRGVWLKQNKDALADVCVALIFVEPDPHKRAALEAYMIGTVRAFGTPQAAAASFAEAEDLGRRLLAGETLAVG